MGNTPLITMVKSRVLTESPEFDDTASQLDNTLSMLCSFLSLDDFVSFLASPAFEQYARTDEPWVVLEVGLYVDHTKTLELIPSNDVDRIVDPRMTGVYPDHVVACRSTVELKQALRLWLTHVTLQ